MAKLAKFVLLLLIGSPAAAAVTKQSDDWVVTQVTGDARVVHAGIQSASLKVSSRVAPGDTFLTGDSGRATLVRGGDYILVAPHSELRIPAGAQPDGFTRVIETLGTMLFKVQHTGIPHFAVQTPMLAAVVKGTTFTVVVDQQRSAVQVIQGVVQVTAAQGGMSRLVEGGRTVFVEHHNPSVLLDANKPSANSPSSSGVKVSGSSPSGLKSVSELTGGLVRVETATAAHAPAAKDKLTDNSSNLSAGGQLVAPPASTASPISVAAATSPAVSLPATAPSVSTPNLSTASVSVSPAALPAITAPPVSLPAATPAVTTPAVTLPSVSTPAVAVPAVTLPAVATPAVTLPSASTPVVTVPSVAIATINTPAVTVPTVSTPAVSVPSVTVPSVTTPAVSVPSVTVPSVTTPAVSVPSVTVPSITTPAVTVPAVTTPPVTLPSVAVAKVSTPIVTVTVALPSVTPPTVTLPSVVTPTVTVPTVSAPALGLPPVTTPAIPLLGH